MAEFLSKIIMILNLQLSLLNRVSVTPFNIKIHFQGTNELIVHINYFGHS